VRRLGHTLAFVSATPFDYDAAPERWRSVDRSTQLTGDVHEPVGRLIVDEQLAPVIDAGGGEGELMRHLPPGWPAAVLDLSPTMLGTAPHPKVRARAERLPVASRSVGAVAMLWMLYHLDQPEAAVREARRALRPGGLFAASTSARTNDPELTDGYPPTTFDAEDAEEIVGRVFDDVVVERWDDKLTLLPDEAAVERYCVSHSLPPTAARRVTPPVLLTKRGCLVLARR
jgi:SAM-dependent methyltransferase